MIRRLRYALTIVRDISMILCPASASVRAGVRDADLLAEREEHVDVMEPIIFRSEGGPTWQELVGCSEKPEPTSELLFAAANQLEQVRCHLHFDHPREEYLSRLVPELRARGISFARQYD